MKAAKICATMKAVLKSINPKTGRDKHDRGLGAFPFGTDTRRSNGGCLLQRTLIQLGPAACKLNGKIEIPFSKERLSARVVRLISDRLYKAAAQAADEAREALGEVVRASDYYHGHSINEHRVPLQKSIEAACKALDVYEAAIKKAKENHR